MIRLSTADLKIIDHDLFGHRAKGVESILVAGKPMLHGL